MRLALAVADQAGCMQLPDNAAPDVPSSKPNFLVCLKDQTQLPLLLQRPAPSSAKIDSISGRLYRDDCELICNSLASLASRFAHNIFGTYLWVLHFITVALMSIQGNAGCWLIA